MERSMGMELANMRDKKEATLPSRGKQESRRKNDREKSKERI